MISINQYVQCNCINHVIAVYIIAE